MLRKNFNTKGTTTFRNNRSKILNLESGFMGPSCLFDTFFLRIKFKKIKDLKTNL